MPKLSYSRNLASYGYLAKRQELISDEKFETLRDRITRKVIEVQEERGISLQAYAAIIGLDPASYCRIKRGQRKLRIENFIAFCVVFNYDIASFMQDDYISHTEAPLKETGVLMGSLSNETLSEIRRVITNSEESVRLKERCATLLTKIIETEDRNEYIGFSADLPAGDLMTKAAQLLADSVPPISVAG